MAFDAFQTAPDPGAFQANAFQIGAQATDLTRIHLPVDFHLARWNFWSGRLDFNEINPRNEQTETVVKRAGVKRIQGGSPSFSSSSRSGGFHRD